MKTNKLSIILMASAFCINTHASVLEGKSLSQVSNFTASNYAPAIVESYNQNWMTNYSGNPIYIHALYQVCVQSCGCNTSQFEVRVGQGTWHDSWRPHITCQLPVGNYQIIAISNVGGYSEHKAYATLVVR